MESFKGSLRRLPFDVLGKDDIADRRGLTSCLFIQGHRTGAAWRTFNSIAELADVDLKLGERPAESVAVHPEFARGAALVALVFLEDGEDKTFLEFTHSLGVENVAFVHLQNQRFQLIFHDASLS
jgi:hypothetical protein